MSSRALWLSVALVFACLSGCSGGGMLPGGPHSMSSAKLDAIVRTYAAANSVDPKLVASVIDAESHGDPSAVSRVGAQGLMQLMPGTASMYRVANPFDPYQNVDGGSRYLHDLLIRFHNDIPLAVAGYNAGPNAVANAHGIPAHSRLYVDRVMSLYRELPRVAASLECNPDPDDPSQC